MSKIEKVVRELSDLYHFYEKIGKLKGKNTAERGRNQARRPRRSIQRTPSHRRTASLLKKTAIR